MADKPHASRNSELAGGISRYSRSAMYKKKALYKKKKVAVKSDKTKERHYKLQPIKGEKNGDKRVILLKKSVRFLIKHISTCIRLSLLFVCSFVPPFAATLLSY